MELVSQRLGERNISSPHLFSDQADRPWIFVRPSEPRAGQVSLVKCLHALDPAWPQPSPRTERLQPCGKVSTKHNCQLRPRDPTNTTTTSSSPPHYLIISNPEALGRGYSTWRERRGLKVGAANQREKGGDTEMWGLAPLQDCMFSSCADASTTPNDAYGPLPVTLLGAWSHVEQGAGRIELECVECGSEHAIKLTWLLSFRNTIFDYL